MHSTTNLLRISPITSREFEVLHLITFGFSTEEIARLLFISKETVKSHRKNLLQKVGAKNTALLVRRAFEFGLVACNA